jgi:SAM-dependent methyltransferase
MSMGLKEILLRPLAMMSEKFDPDRMDAPQECGFFDRDALGTLKPFTRNMDFFHSRLRRMLQEHHGVRKWEYGTMLRGLPDLSGKDILDIGSGPSFLPGYLAHQFRSRVTVLDLPQPFTVETNELRRRLEHDGVTLKLGDMRDLPFKDGSFDIVLSISVIEHLSHSSDHENFPTRESFIDDTKRTLHQMYRVLRPDGWMYLTTDAYVPGRVDNDRWAGKMLDGEPYGAYPIDQIEKIFIHSLKEAGALFPYPTNYSVERLLESKRYSSYRNRFMTVFNLFAKKPSDNDRAESA